MADQTVSAQTSAFVADHARAILITRRRDDGLQAAPIRVMLDADQTIVAATRETTAKVRNLVRDPRFALCVISNEFGGGVWMTMEGQARIIGLPEALDSLRAFYLARDGSVAPEDEFAATMQEQGRVMLHFDVERSTPTPSR